MVRTSARVRRLAVWLLVGVLGVQLSLVVVTPAGAVPAFSSLTGNPANAPLLADALASGTMDGVLSASASGAAGASASAPVVTAAAPSGFGISAVGGQIAGLAAALGGLLGFTVTPDSGGSGLPTGVGAGQSWGAEYMSVRAVTFSAGQASVTATRLGPNQSRGIYCWQLKNDGTVAASVMSNAGFPWAETVFTWTAEKAIRCWYTVQNSTVVAHPLSGLPTTARQLYDWVPGKGGGVYDYVPFLTAGDWSTLGALPPNRWVENTVTCKNGAGTVTNYSGRTYPAAPIAGGQSVPVAGLMCNTGERLTGWTSTLKTEGGADKVLSTGTVPAGLQSVPIGCLASGVVCKLDLEIRSVSGSTVTWKSCLASGVDCSGWWASPTRSTEFRCLYGPGPVPVSTVASVPSTVEVRALADCSVYRNYPNLTPAAPLNGASNTPQDDVCSMSWGDVLTGAVVYKAFVCALQWAFVPEDGYLSGKIAAVRAEIDNSVMGDADAVASVVVDGVSVWSPAHVATLPGGDSPNILPVLGVQGGGTFCLGPRVADMTLPTGVVPGFYPLSTCSGVMKTVRDVLYPLSVLMVWVACLGICTRNLGNALGVKGPESSADAGAVTSGVRS